MTYLPVANPTTDEPSHQVTLYDGTTTVGLKLYNTRTGKADHRAMARTPLNRTALKTYSGSQKYGDFEQPYIAIAQDDWSGGRGQLSIEDNTSKYNDSYMMDTTGEKMRLVGMPQHTSGYRTGDSNSLRSYSTNSRDWSTYVNWVSLYDGAGFRYLASSFVASSTCVDATVEILVKYVGTPGELTLDIYSDTAGSPASTILAPQHQHAGSNAYNTNDYVGTYTALPFQVLNLVAGTTYWVVVYDGIAGVTPSATNHWKVGTFVNSSVTTKSSTNGSTWSANTNDLIFRVLPTRASFVAHYFTYRGQLYCATQPDDGSAGKVYMNGYRGVCDSNTTDLTYLNDSTQTGWASSAIAGSVAKIISGPGAQENISWRIITSSSSGVAITTVATDWNITHTVDSEYVILRSNVWTELTSTGITTPITDVCVANDIAYFAQGDNTPVRRYVCYNLSGTFTEVWGNVGPYATFMKAIADKTLGTVIYMARRAAALSAGFGSTIDMDIAPKGYTTNFSLSSTVLEDIVDVWNEETYSNVTAICWFPGLMMIRPTATFTTGIIATEAITSTDVRPFNIVNIEIAPSINLAAGDLQFLMDNTAKCVSPIFTLDIPALIANKSNKISLDITPAGVTGADAIISVGLKIAVDKDAQFDITVLGPITLVNEFNPIELQDRITGLEAYGDPELLWVFTEGGLGYVENDQYNTVPIREMESVASHRNGLAHCVGDVFLHFSLQDGVERYYRQNLDDIGPNLGEGMPSLRRGNISAMVSYPGRIYAAIDGGVTGYSSVLCYKGSGWHEIYRSSQINRSIRSLYIQSLPDNDIQRLWIGQAADLIVTPICLNPEQETEFVYNIDGYMITSWIYAGMKDVVKYWKALKLFVENSVASTNCVLADYQLDNATTWTTITGDFDTQPLVERQLSAATPPAVNGRRIRFRIRLYPTASTTCPYIVASVVEGVGFSTPKYAYSMSAVIGEGELNIDMVGDDDTTFATMALNVAKVDSWAANHTLLTFHSVYGAFDDKVVYLDPVPMSPTEFIKDNSAGEGREKHLFQITVIEA